MMRTIETETMSDTTVITRDESAPVTTVGNYEPVRFNATKHGILSRLAVLAHEDHAEFDDLLAALLDEHRPAGMTERHLIEELATIIWRKRRVLLAEGAKINEGLKSAASSSKSVMASAAPFQRGMASENTDVRDLLRRVLTIHIDPRCATPATMTYKGFPVDKVRKHRCKYVVAVLTIIQAWRNRHASRCGGQHCHLLRCLVGLLPVSVDVAGAS